MTIVRANEFKLNELHKEGILVLIKNENKLLATSTMNRFDVEEHQEQLREYHKMLDRIENKK